MSITINEQYLRNFVSAEEIMSMQNEVTEAHNKLRNGTGEGSDFIGWVNWAENYIHTEEYARIKAAGKRIREDSDVLIVAGIGGSYLGARAVIEAIQSPLYNELNAGNGPKIYFLGNTLSTAYTQNVLSLCEGKNVSVIVISKSGTTTETAVAFRFFKEYLEKRGFDYARRHIYVITDKAKGALRPMTNADGFRYESFIVPDDIGGRYSVLTPVGLLPIAAAGIDIDALMQGAIDASAELKDNDLVSNPAYRYAAIRNLLYRKGKKAELLCSYEPRMTLMNEWWKQLYGESEGKDGKGLFPASVVYSTDLHSLGQFVQEGDPMLFETVLHIGYKGEQLPISFVPGNFDGLNYLAYKPLSYVNESAFRGTLQAHTAGNVPNVVLEVPEMNEHELGYLIYFFELACGISGYVLGVNPFNQPGVEAYKKAMFTIMGKPGYKK